MVDRRPLHLIVQVLLALQQGDIIAEKYRVTHVIAQGGMGIVIAAEHMKLEQHVALKFMLPTLARNPDAAARFLQEARAAARLQSEHVARILDVAELDSGVPYIVMEYLEGGDLASLIHRSPGQLPVEDVVDYVLQACEAIAEAHTLGIIHRDLKPENLFLSRRRGGKPCVKVLDFGISKVAEAPGRDRARVTTQDVMGSPAYMSPEQMQSTSNVDARSDIWSLGVILYELVSRERPFEGSSIAELCFAVLQRGPRPLEQLRTDLPPGLAHVIHRCLAKDPAGRYASVPELVQALAPFTATRSPPAVEGLMAFENAPDDPLDRRSTPPTAQTRGAHATTGRGIGSRGPLLALGGVVLVTAFGFGARSISSAPVAAATAGAAEVISSAEPFMAVPAPAIATAVPDPSAPSQSAAPQISAAPVLVGAPKPTGSAESSPSGAPHQVAPASKGGRLTVREPSQAQASKRTPAPEAATSSEEDAFSARK
jgi:eukaryotic-like serine/threonine-protein kinase